MTRLTHAFVAAAFCLGTYASPANAADSEVHMLHKVTDGFMVFEPSALTIELMLPSSSCPPISRTMRKRFPTFFPTEQQRSSARSTRASK